VSRILDEECQDEECQDEECQVEPAKSVHRIMSFKGKLTYSTTLFSALFCEAELLSPEHVTLVYVRGG
jgi:hypothetical protein